MVMVHGLMVAGLGRSADLSEIVGSQEGRGPSWKRDRSSNVVVIQAGCMARPRAEAPETQIYFITHRSGAFPVLRVRIVVRGERASRSIVNRTTALWSIWMAASLILAGLGFAPRLWVNAGLPNRRFARLLRIRRLGSVNVEAGWMASTTNKRKETNINSGVV